MTGPGSLPRDADFYLVAVSDSAIPEVAGIFREYPGIWLHTAGAVSMDVFEGYFRDYGVLYPLQTFSAGREISLEEIPFLVEGSGSLVTGQVHQLAWCISRKVSLG